MLSESATAIISGGRVEADLIKDLTVTSIVFDDNDTAKTNCIVSGSFLPGSFARERREFFHYYLYYPHKYPQYNFKHRLQIVRRGSKWYITSIELLEIAVKIQERG